VEFLLKAEKLCISCDCLIFCTGLMIILMHSRSIVLLLVYP
jgi:hypothetical protein